MSPHELLFESYCEEMLDAKGFVDAWWRDLVVRELQLAGNELDARRALKRRWIAGPASHPHVIAVVRKYYLACQALNDEEDSDVGGEVEPIVFLTEWMLDGKHDDLAAFLAPLSYWPIGFDDEGDPA